MKKEGLKFTKDVFTKCIFIYNFLNILTLPWNYHILIQHNHFFSLRLLIYGWCTSICKMNHVLKILKSFFSMSSYFKDGSTIWILAICRVKWIFRGQVVGGGMKLMSQICQVDEMAAWRCTLGQNIFFLFQTFIRNIYFLKHVYILSLKNSKRLTKIILLIHEEKLF